MLDGLKRKVLEKVPLETIPKDIRRTMIYWRLGVPQWLRDIVFEHMRETLEPQGWEFTQAAIGVYRDQYGRILILKRGNTSHPNQWACPGGNQDDEEDLIRTAERESFDETKVRFKVKRKLKKGYGGSQTKRIMKEVEIFELELDEDISLEKICERLNAHIRESVTNEEHVDYAFVHTPWELEEGEIVTVLTKSILLEYSPIRYVAGYFKSKLPKKLQWSFSI